MQHLQTAIILKRTAYGDADWIVTFLSREAGRLSGIARSARSSKKRFGGAFEPGSLVELKFVSSKNAGLARIDEAVIKRPVLGALKSLENIGALGRALNLALAFLKEAQSVPKRFDLLNNWIEHLTSSEFRTADGIFFEVEWLKASGFGPHLSSCLVCGAAKDKAAWAFDIEQGGLICSRCNKTSLGHGRSLRTYVPSNVLDGIGSLDIGSCLDESALAGISNLIGGYIDHVVGRKVMRWSV